MRSQVETSIENVMRHSIQVLKEKDGALGWRSALLSTIADTKRRVNEAARKAEEAVKLNEAA